MYNSFGERPFAQHPESLDKLGIYSAEGHLTLSPFRCAPGIFDPPGRGDCSPSPFQGEGRGEGDALGERPSA